MDWYWRYVLASGGETSSRFPSQSEAEAWLGESWHELYDAGATTVALMEAEREVYTMSLEPR